jgi:hypothetical protein
MSDDSESLFVAIEDYVRRSVAPLRETIEAQAREITELRGRLDAPRVDPSVGELRSALDSATKRIADLEGRGPIIIHGVDGKDGLDGIGQQGEKGERGTDGRDGRDGVSIVEATIDADGMLLLTMSDGSARKPGRVKGSDGRDAVAPTIPDVGEMVRAAVIEAIAAIPRPKDGRDGADGKSIDRDEISAMIERDVRAAVDALPKPKDGRDGRDGTDGAIGPRGELGERGEKGEAGKDGLDGSSVLSALVDADGELVLTMSDGRQHKAGIVRGRDGRDGIDAKDGAPGAQGAPGRDALAIRPLPYIDDEKSLPAGSWACHAGGLWQAERDTDPLRGRPAQSCGWLPVVVGEKSLDLVLDDDGRTVVVKRVSSTGIALERRFAVPVVLDRGVYSVGKAYARGDAVTRGGSLFIAKIDAPKGLPGASDDWRLAVKAGRDGKDAPQ